MFENPARQVRGPGSEHARPVLRWEAPASLPAISGASRQGPRPPGKRRQDGKMGAIGASKRDLDPGASPLHFFGAEVRRAREAVGMTLADLGAAVPCDASTVSKVEAGLLRPTKRFVAACLETFPHL